MDEKIPDILNKNYPHTGLVLEGGGFRGMYTAGVLDALLGNQILFDYLIGVSAGAAYGISYASRQLGRNLRGNKYHAHPQYCGVKHLVKQGNFFNWNFVYKTIPTQLNPFDYQALHNSSTKMKVVLTNCSSGKASYKDCNSNNPDELRDLLTATSALPFISRKLHINGEAYLDGGIADSIPVQQALKDGNKRVVIVLTRPREYEKQQVKFPSLVKWGYRKYPQLASAILQRSSQYNKTIQEIDKLEANGRAFVIRPSETLPVSRLENKPETLEQIYHMGKKQMEEMIPQLLQWLDSSKNLTTKNTKIIRKGR